MAPKKKVAKKKPAKASEGSTLAKDMAVMLDILADIADDIPTIAKAA